MGLANIHQYQAGLVAGEFKETTGGKWHEFNDVAPCEWSAERGATHTLFTLDGTRPARILKTVAYIGVDESDEGDIVWEKWDIRNHREFNRAH